MESKQSHAEHSRRQFLRTGVGGGAVLLTGSLRTFGSADPETAVGVRKSIADESASPSWTKDLIIYEIGSTHAFTSPHGPGSGTFGSMATKLAYLEELGVTSIWMDPPSLQDQHRFFYNMWCRYAVVEPNKFDPSLGSEGELKKMVDESHRRGIRIFPDIKTHGVMKYSPLAKENPNWFRGSHWEMADYDWYGGHTDLDDWWVKIWSDCVMKYEVDGFRLDVDIFRPDLWKRIRENAAAAGHPIIIFEEDNSALPGVVDFSQHENAIYGYGSIVENEVLTRDMPGFYDRKFGKVGHYHVVIQYGDGSRAEGNSDGEGPLRVHLDGLTADKSPRRKEHWSWYMPDGIPDMQLTVENVASKPIGDITVHDDILGPWHLNAGERWLAVEGNPPLLKLYLSTVGHGWPTIQLSCHDQGWEGYPLDRNPYTAQGSRALMGYSCLFAPAIPIFFSGEEFNATFRPLPWQSPNLYGGKDPGKGRWLYGCMLDWEEVKDPAHRAMLEDVKKMIAIRKHESEVLSIRPEKERPKLVAVPLKDKSSVPVPYLRWNNQTAILVAANRDTMRDVNLRMDIPLRAIGLAGRARYRVTDLWTGAPPKTYDKESLANFACTVRRDKTEGGGLRVFKIEPST